MSAAALALLAAAVPPAASDMQYLGLWEGTVGKYPVTACFMQLGDDSVRGSYYYRSKLVPISLDRYEHREEGWIEGAANENHWALDDVAGDRLGGTWHGGGKALPIALQRRKFTPAADDWAGACGSVEYVGPRAFKPRFTRQPASLGGWSYEIVRWQPPAHFADDSGMGFSFAIEKPGDPLILEELARNLPDGRIEGDFFQCISGAGMGTGVDGFWDLATVPIYAGPRYLATRTTSDTYCGGAHPNYDLAFAVYDRQTGKEVDVKRWLAPKGFARSEYGDFMITPALRKAALAQREADPEIDAETAKECGEALAGSDFWSAGLAKAGMVLVASLPHAMTPCREEITVSWAKLAPFLNSEGKKARAALAGN